MSFSAAILLLALSGSFLFAVTTALVAGGVGWLAERTLAASIRACSAAFIATLTLELMVLALVVSVVLS